MCAPSPPPAPDTVGAAVAQSAANKEAAIATSKLNNPNVVNPFGTATFTEGVPAAPGDVARPTLTQTLNPEQQKLLDIQNRVKTTLGTVGEQGATGLQGIVGTPLDLSGAPAAPTGAEGARQKVIDALNSRINEDYGNTRDQANSDLIAAGLRPGTKAYQDRMFAIDRARNDARNQAEATAGNEVTRSFGIDTEARKNAIAELLAKRQTPLNEITALMSGSQVSNPFAKGAGAGVSDATIAPVNIAGLLGQQNQYQTDVFNQQVGSSNANKQAAAGVAGAGLNGAIAAGAFAGF